MQHAKLPRWSLLVNLGIVLSLIVTASIKVMPSVAAPARQTDPTNGVTLDPALESVIQAKIAGSGRVRLALFVMSQCPFGVRAEQALAPILEEFGDKIEFTLYFIASEDGNGSFLSLHGQAEVDEDIRQVVIAKYYPDKFLNYLLARSADYTSDNWQQYADRVGIDTAKVREIAGGEEGKDLLRANIRPGNELNIGASPTLFVDNEEYAGAIFAIPDTTGLGDTVPSTPDTTTATSSDDVTNSGSTAKTGWLLFALVALVSLGLAGLIFWFRLRRLGAGMSLRQQWPLLTGLLILVVVVVAGSYELWLKPTYFAGTVTGQVLDAETDAPIEGASVTIHGTRFVTQTDANGEYHFANVPMGVRIVVARQAGFTLDAQEVNIVDGQATESLTLYLTRLEPPTVIGPKGGIIQGGTTLTIPVGALPTDTEITVTPLQQRRVPNLASLYRAASSGLDEQTQADGKASILMAVDFGPEGTTFSKPVTVSFTLPSTAPEDLNISIFQMDSKTLLWSLLETVPVKKGEATASFQVNHFSSLSATSFSWSLSRCVGYVIVNASGKKILDCYNDLKVERCTSDKTFYTLGWFCAETLVSAVCLPGDKVPGNCWDRYCKQVSWKSISCVQCLTNADCPDDGNPCTDDICEDNNCSYPPKCTGDKICCPVDNVNVNCCPPPKAPTSCIPGLEACCGPEIPATGCPSGQPPTACTSGLEFVCMGGPDCVSQILPPTCGGCCCNGTCGNCPCSTNGSGSLPPVSASQNAAVQSVSPEGGKVTFGNETVQLVFPPEAVSSTVSVVYLPQPKTSITGFKVVQLFNLEAYTGDCTWQKFTDFNKPVTIQVSYSQEEVTGIDESKLGLYYFDNALNQWVALPSTVSPAEKNVKIQKLNYFTLHFTLYALMAPAGGASH